MNIEIIKINKSTQFSQTLMKLIGCIVILLVSTTCFAQWQLGLDIDGESAGDQSGTSVSMSADGLTVAIGARYNDTNINNLDTGHVRVYKYISGVWIQQGADIDGEAAEDYSGYSVSLSADGLTLAIGAIGNNNNNVDAGHVRVYQLISDIWTQQGADIDGESFFGHSGYSVSLSDDGLILAVGEPSNGVFGHTRVFQFISGIWTQLGMDIDGEGEGDLSGGSVSLSDDGLTVAIGAKFNNVGAGHVKVYQLISDVWTQQGTDIDGEAQGDQSGISVSLSADGLTVAVGAVNNDNENGSDAGHVRVYQLISEAWTQLGADINGEAAGDFFGHSVSLSANGLSLAIGAFSNAGNGTNSGHVRVYQLISGEWTQQAADIDGEVAVDNSGHSVSLSGDGLTVAVGAILNDGNGIDAGHVRVYHLDIIFSSSFE